MVEVRSSQGKSPIIDEIELTVPDSGLARLQLGRKQKRVFYAEGYSRVTITVP